MLKFLFHNTVVHPIAGWLWFGAAVFNKVADVMHERTYHE